MRRGFRTRPIPGLSREASLLKVCRLLNEQGAKYLVIGAWACSLHGLVRATKDVDLLIPRDLENTGRILEALKSLLWGIAGEMDPREVTGKPITIIGDTPRVDLLTVASRVKFEEAARTALETVIDGVKIFYVDLKTLVKTKATDRLQDQADSERLQKIAAGRKKKR